ncbi:MAG: hypothetical protein JWO28_303 [Hyphomicrobiales bacterium]|nr:hypothetical protein [Hyphomicrobiales bacterium]
MPLASIKSRRAWPARDPEDRENGRIAAAEVHRPAALQTRRDSPLRAGLSALAENRQLLGKRRIASDFIEALRQDKRANKSDYESEPTFAPRMTKALIWATGGGPSRTSSRPGRACSARQIFHGPLLTPLLSPQYPTKDKHHPRSIAILRPSPRPLPQSIRSYARPWSPAPSSAHSPPSASAFPATAH